MDFIADRERGGERIMSLYCWLPYLPPYLPVSLLLADSPQDMDRVTRLKMLQMKLMREENKARVGMLHYYSTAQKKVNLPVPHHE